MHTFKNVDDFFLSRLGKWKKMEYRKTYIFHFISLLLTNIIVRIGALGNSSRGVKIRDGTVRIYSKQTTNLE